MNAVEIDIERRTACAQTGITAGAYTQATGEHGLATGLGDTPTAGVGGITLAGGLGFLDRKHGLTIDDLVAAEVVTANGEVLEVDADAHADLFWALRGGGGNFGVATRLQLRLHPIDEVVGGILLLPASADVITGLMAVAEAAPEELSVTANIRKAPPLPFIPAEQHGKPVFIALMVYAGDVEAGDRAIAPIRALATPLADMVRPIHYPEIYAGPEGPRPAFDAGTNILLDAPPAGAAETILEHLETATAAVAQIQLRVLGGAIAHVPDEATAFGHRKSTLMVNVTAIHAHPEQRPEQQAWVHSLVNALAGGTTAAAYVGFLGDEGEEGVRRAYPPATLERLAQVKRQYDPDNLFRLNLNVTPDVATDPSHSEASACSPQIDTATGPRSLVRAILLLTSSRRGGSACHPWPRRVSSRRRAPYRSGRRVANRSSCRDAREVHGGDPAHEAPTIPRPGRARRPVRSQEARRRLAVAAAAVRSARPRPTKTNPTRGMSSRSTHLLEGRRWWLPC
jgi:FAD/FMN-containing dehydrogenase